MTADRRFPRAEELVIDHVGHFVHDRTALAPTLAALGFTTTPEALHTVPGTDGVPTLAGTGNLCVMLERGYLEFLFRTADTPLAVQFDQAIARYAGVHLAAFGTAEPDVVATRLTAHGFSPQPPVSLRRMVEEREARFTVVRVPPEAMPEGRIQFVSHHTADVVWQPQWLAHGNGARGLLDLVLASDAVERVALRWGRFLDRPVRRIDGGARIATERGNVVILETEAAAARLGAGNPPTFPAYGLEVADLDHAADALSAGGAELRRSGRVAFANFPPALGRGMWVVVESASHLPWT